MSAARAVYRCTCGYSVNCVAGGLSFTCPSCLGPAVREAAAELEAGDYAPATVDDDGELVDPPAPVDDDPSELAGPALVLSIESGLEALEERVDELDTEMTRQLRELAERVLELERNRRGLS